MNVQEYISSGIVESYVLGLADEAERIEFEAYCISYEEVRAARDAFETALEKQARAGSANPPAHIKEKIFVQLGINNAVTRGPLTGENGERNNLTDGSSGNYRSSVDAGTFPENDLSQVKRVPRLGWSRYLAAASVILLIGSTILNFYLFNQYKEYSGRYADLLTAQTELAGSNRALQTSLDNYRNTLSHLNDPAMSIIKMVGTQVPKNASPDPSSIATIYWNKKSSELYLMINNLPKNVSGKQYQLWAMVNGKPVSAGVFDINQADPVLKMSNVAGAEAFAVTLEAMGGSETPKGEMYVLGAI